MEKVETNNELTKTIVTEDNFPNDGKLILGELYLISFC